jgi:hypothetical protein
MMICIGHVHSRYIFNALATSQLGLTRTERNGPKPVIRTTGTLDGTDEAIQDDGVYIKSLLEKEHIKQSY